MSERVAVSSSIDVAEWFTERASAEGRALDGIRLQRLLFLAQAHFAALTGGGRLMPAVFVSSDLGPVAPDVLRGFSPDSIVERDAPLVTGPIAAFLKGIWRAYGDMAPSLVDRQVVTCAAAQAAAKRGANSDIAVDAMARSFENAAQNADLLAAMRAAGASRASGSAEPKVSIPKFHRGKPVERWVPGAKRNDDS